MAETAVAATVVAFAAVLRIVGSGSGLPLALLNPDETNIVPRAWDLVHGGGLDPGWYDYPSLLFLLLAPSQIGLDAPSYGTARVVAIAIGLAGVGAAWWLGRVTYGRAAALTGAVGVAVATTHVAYSRMAVTDVLLTLGVTVCLALLVTDRLEWAGVAAGLAASAKYPGVLLVVPLLVAGYGVWRRTAIGLALAAAAFALTSPFVLVHAG
ncbi:MAG TPA: glycosyltransferase family 39 protein, partial [Gaiella sp.]|nr:glycosyltransferase family 39 protein [Gaiella sp.]